MKKIIRLTESDLIRLVKRVINEQPTPSTGIGKSVANEFIEALSKTFDDDEKGALKAIKRLQTPTDFIEFQNQIQKETGKNICEYINSELSEFNYNEYSGINKIIQTLSGKDCNRNNIKNYLARSLQDRV